MAPSVRRLSRTRSQGANASVTSVEVTHATNESRQISETDDFLRSNAAIGGLFITPPYDVGRLFAIVEQSNTILPCVAAMVTNVVKPGWEVRPSITNTEMDGGEQSEAASFIDHANSEESLASVMAKVIHDRECVGFGFLEVIRDNIGRIALFRHAKSLHTRIGLQTKDTVLVEYNIKRGRRTSTVTEVRRFRRYLQVVAGRTVFFKEFGDPRDMNARTGLYSHEEGYTDDAPATEIFHFRLQSNETYGVPRWINQLPSVIGSRESEEVNLNYFRENTVPPIMMMVSGGRLTRQSYQEVMNTMNKQRGKDTHHRFTLVEAVGEGDSIDGKNSSNVKVEIEKLTDARQSDGLFSQYDEANQSKIMSSWRLPRNAIGRSKDGNFTGEAVAAFVVESQVYAPERNDLDEIINKNFVNGERGMNLRTCMLVSRTPQITNPEMVIRTLTALNTIGAITPRHAQLIANTMLQIEIPPYPQPGQEGYEEWMDIPIQMSIRNPYKDHEAGAGEVVEGEQTNKTELVKEIEQTGNVGLRQPKNGEQIHGA